MVSNALQILVLLHKNYLRLEYANNAQNTRNLKVMEKHAVLIHVLMHKNLRLVEHAKIAQAEQKPRVMGKNVMEINVWILKNYCNLEVVKNVLNSQNPLHMDSNRIGWKQRNHVSTCTMKGSRIRLYVELKSVLLVLRNCWLMVNVKTVQSMRRVKVLMARNADQICAPQFNY